MIIRCIAKPLRDFIVEASSNLEHSSLIPFFLGYLYSSRVSLRGRSVASLRQNCVTVFSFSKNHFSSPSVRWSIVLLISSCCFFFNDTATTEIYTLSLHDALPI